MLRTRDEQIRKLTKERDDLQARTNWMETELGAAKKRETDALNLVREFSKYVANPGNVVTKAAVLDSRLVREGHLTGSKVVTILVDFSARVEASLREMRKLLAHLDPDQALDLSGFPEIPFSEVSPIRMAPGSQIAPGGPSSVPRPEQGPQGATITREVPDLNPQPSEPSLPDPVPIPQSPKVPEFNPTAQTPTREVDASVRGDLLKRIGALSSHTPMRGLKLLERISPRKEVERIDLDESPDVQGKQPRAQVSAVEDDEDEETDEESDSPPPVTTRRMLTRAAKATPTKSSIRASAGQLGSSSKKARKGT